MHTIPDKNFIEVDDVRRFCWRCKFHFVSLLQVAAKGFMLGRHSYLRSGWNVMDGILVFISLLDIIISLTAKHSPKIFGVLRVFRLLRTLRPLRSVSVCDIQCCVDCHSAI